MLQEFLRNRRAAMKKADDGLAMLKVLYADEAHISLPRDTAHRALALAIELVEESRAIMREGEQSIERARQLFAVA
jgi:hypothetical protein